MPDHKGFAASVDSTVIDNAKNKDMLALKKLYDLYSEPCYNLIYRMTYNHSDALDITQEVFVTLLEKLESFSPTGSFGAWLKRITVNKTLNHLKLNSKFANLEEAEQLEVQEEHLDTSWLSATIDLEKLLARIPAHFRIVLWLYEVEGYSHQQIADDFNKSLSFSKVTLFRAYQACKQLVENSND